MPRAFERVAMHAIVFGTKRAFHSVLRVTRRPLLMIGLTAARFDLLSALRQLARVDTASGARTLQSELRRTLGVCASVVSRMLRSLETLGLVTRERPRYGDRRQRVVRRTERGLACIADAHRALLRAVRRLVCTAICFGGQRDLGSRLFHLQTLESYLSALREQFGDCATLYYPWGHPDD